MYANSVGALINEQSKKQLVSLATLVGTVDPFSERCSLCLVVMDWWAKF
jgi:hypothetical protein